MLPGVQDNHQFGGAGEHMRKRTRIILWSVGALAAIAAGATVVILLVSRPGRAADRLVGSWEGQGDERTRFEGTIGKE